MKSNLFPVIQEGWIYSISSFIAFILFFLFGFSTLSFLSATLTLFFIYTFRNPERALPLFSDNSLLSPIDGRVQNIVELDNEEYSYRVDIDSSIQNVGLLRSPANAKVIKVDFYNGTRVSSRSKLFNSLNENVMIVFKDNTSHEFMLKHTLKQSFTKLHLNLKMDEELTQTARYGFMSNGLTSIYLHQDFRFNLSIGDEIKAAESLVGYFS